MKKRMAYPPGMLVRKDGNIRFQYRIPKDLLQYYPRPIMSENLGTSYRALAARMIHARKAELEREFQRLRSQTAQVLVPCRATITDDEAATIARTILASAISADEELRHDGLIDAYSLAPELGPSMQSPGQEAVRLAASRGDYSAFTDVVEVVEHFLSNYDSNAPMYKKRQAALGLLLEFLGDVPVSALRQIDIDNYFRAVVPPAPTVVG